ncbi:interleukin-4 [Sturnira hondurensis]|uniref:interleukin-4 n=1 Tax=Sturnira hondurensis TaxID=192404 RepID=UPI00187AE480|nr:interleukin-4 [Sturnira hondurensis]
MGLPAHLIPALVCLLACSSNFVHGRKPNIALEETIKTLNILTARKDPRCMELPIADVLVALKNTTERETFCRAATALRQLYRHHECADRRFLSRLDRSLSGLAGQTTCPSNEVRKSTLKDFLERLRRIMQEKYARG